MGTIVDPEISPEQAYMHVGEVSSVLRYIRLTTRTYCMVTHIARVRINRIRLPVLHMVS